MTATDPANLALDADPLQWVWWRQPAVGRLASLLTLFVVALFATLPGWLPGRVLAPTGVLQETLPWDSVPPRERSADHNYRLQLTARVLALHQAALPELRQFHAPLWNAHQYLGLPLLGGGQIAPFYPTFLFHALPPTWSYTLAASAQLFLAGLGAWLLARRADQVQPLGAVIAGIVYMLCGPLLLGLHTNAAQVAPWLPYLVLLTEGLIDRVTAPRLVLTTLALALQFLGGDPVASGAILLTCALLILVRAILPRDAAVAPWQRIARALRAAGALVLAMAIAFTLAGIQWGPVIETFLGTVPVGDKPGSLPSGLALAQANPLAPALVGVLALLLSVFALFLSPRRTFVWTWTTLGSLALTLCLAYRFWPLPIRAWADLSFVGPSLALIPACLTVALLAGEGLSVLLGHFAAAPDVRRLRNAAFVAGTVLLGVMILWSVAWATARGPGHWLFGAARLAILVLFVAAGAAPWIWLLRRCRTGPRRVDVSVGDRPIYHTDPAEVRYGPCPPALLLPVGLMTVALVTAELLTFALIHNRGTPAAAHFPSPSVLQALQDRRATGRLAATPGVLSPNLASAYGLDDLRGAAPRIPARLKPWLDRLTFGPDGGQLTHVSDLPLRLLSFRHLIATKADPPPGGDWKLLYPYKGTVLYDNPEAYPRAWVAARTQVKRAPGGPIPEPPAVAEVYEQLFAPWSFDPRDVVLVDRDISAAVQLQIEGSPEWKNWPESAGRGQGRGTVEYEEISPTEITLRVRNSGGGWLIVASQYLPGWEASVGARLGRFRATPIPRVLPVVAGYGALTAIPLPSGTVDVDLSYRPLGWRYGVFASLAGLLTLLILMGAALFHPVPGTPNEVAASDEPE